MSNKKKTIIITAVVAVITLVLSPKIFINAPDLPEPSSFQLPFFIVLAVIESLSIGYALAFLLVNWKRAKEQGKKLVHVALFWLIGSWWVHDGLHRMNGHDLGGLLKIEYGFHVTLIIAAVSVALHFLKQLDKPQV